MPSGVSAALRTASRARSGARLRIAWAIASFVLIQSAICAIAALPMVVFWHWLLAVAPPGLPRFVLLSLAAVPSYGVFAILLMAVSAFTLRAVGWQTPPDMQMRIADFEWPVLNWVRSMAA